jgi:hypothetical protein
MMSRGIARDVRDQAAAGDILRSSNRKARTSPTPWAGAARILKKARRTEWRMHCRFWPQWRNQSPDKMPPGSGRIRLARFTRWILQRPGSASSSK